MARKYKTLSLEDYNITKNGEVINNNTNRVLKPQLNGKGYYRVSIGGKLMFVHRLVAQKYIPNPENKAQVNHKDGNKLNNNVNNLEWVENIENRKHAVEKGLHLSGEKCSYSKLTENQVLCIREHNEISNPEFAKLFNVSRNTISSARNYKSWKMVEKLC